MDATDVISLIVAIGGIAALAGWLSARNRLDRRSSRTYDPVQRESLEKISRDIERGRSAGDGFFVP